MKQVLYLALVLLVIPFATKAQSQTDSNQTIQSFIGNWTIDLRPTPESEGYYQTFQVLSIDNNTFTGTFYGSSIEAGLINSNWDKLYFAFTTSDLNNEYYHSGYFENGKLSGMTYCPGREFAAPWTGEKGE